MTTAEPVAPGRHAGKPIRKSANDLNDTFMNEDPGVSASFLTRCPSKPVRNVCMPCDQETWSAASNWLVLLSTPKAVFEPKLDRPEMVTSEKLSTPGVRSVIPNCVFVYGLELLPSAISR